jgi:tetratricopeptide (TPR) repeat protein
MARCQLDTSAAEAIIRHLAMILNDEPSLRERLNPVLVNLPIVFLVLYGCVQVYTSFSYPDSLRDFVQSGSLFGALGGYASSIVSHLAAPSEVRGIPIPRSLLLPFSAAAGSLAGGAAAYALLESGISVSLTLLAAVAFVAGNYAAMLLRLLRPRVDPPTPAVVANQATKERTTESREAADFSAEEARLVTQLAQPPPMHHAAANRLIEIYRQTRRYDQAAGVYDRLITERPRDYDLIVRKAELYLEMGDRRRYNEIIRQAERIGAEASFQENVGTNITLLEAEVQGLNFFSDFIWPLQPRVNVLLGKNGYGKSHLLRAIVATLQNETEVTGEFVEKARGQAMIRIDARRADTRVRTVRRSLVFDETFGKVPVLAIPDMRYIEKAGETFGPPASTVSDLRSQGAEQFMRNESFDAVILTFLYEICLDYFDHGKTFDLPIFRLIEKTLQDLTGSVFRFHDIVRRDNARFEIQVLTEGNESTPLPLQKGSQGTLSVLCMSGLIFRYLTKVFPNVPAAEVTKQQAIVVIDEIDAHLHPVWQQKILQQFRDTFPNVQFIVTAHTPLVVAGCKSREVAVLQIAENGFAVKVIDNHFIGATAAQMYQQIFDVTEKDKMFLRLKGMTPQKGDLERQVASLESQPEKSPEQEGALRKLKEDLYYLREVEALTAKRDKLEHIESDRQTTELKMEELRGEAAQLKASLERAEQQVAALGDESTVVQFVREFVETNRERADIVEPFIKFLSRNGGNKQAASLLEGLLEADPENLNYMKGLAVQYQALKDYPRATSVLRRAQSAFPDDQGVKEALSRLDVVEGRASATEG